jgi:hypothetical protein
VIRRYEKENLISEIVFQPVPLFHRSVRFNFISLNQSRFGQAAINTIDRDANSFANQQIAL